MISKFYFPLAIIFLDKNGKLNLIIINNLFKGITYFLINLKSL